MFHSVNRGFALLPALILVGILAVTAMGIENFTPEISTQSQTAAADCFLSNGEKYCPDTGSGATPATPPPRPTAELAKKQAAADCEKRKAEAAKSTDHKSADVNQNFQGVDILEKNHCIGAVLNDRLATDANLHDVKNYQCVGEATQVAMNKKGNGKITSTPDATIKPPGKCVTVFCDSSSPPKCGTPQEVSGGGSVKNWAANPDIFKELPPDQQKVVSSALDPRTAGGLNDAFSAQQDAVDENIAAQKGAVTDARAELNKIVNDCQSKGGGPGDCSVLNNSQVATAYQKVAEEQKRLDELNKQKETLAAAHVALKPIPGDCPGNPSCPGTIDRQPPGLPPNTFSPPSPRDPGFGGGEGGYGGGYGGGLGGLGSFLGGLARGLGGATGFNQHPQPPRQPPQTCSTDSNIYAQQRQQYQDQLQQYNYQQQQANYQRQRDAYNSRYYGNDYYNDGGYYDNGYSGQNYPLPPQPQPCTPGTGNQCSAQPQQPPASNCSVGYWKAVYRGVCITGWQCTSAGQLHAQLSCEPKVADVGMTLAISYSCSAGTASSNAFQTTTQPSGSATTTIAVPPAGTNIATYALTCTDQGKTAGAQCSVQVGKPSIILVGNPKTVKANETSLLGWITSGMKSCVISSPDQADFTSRNAYNTSVNGTATTSPISSQARFLLHCETLAGGTHDATTTIGISN